MRIASKGQVTIPVAIREGAGLMPSIEVGWDGSRVVAPSRSGRSRGARAVARLRGGGDIATSTDDIMALTRSDR